MQEIKPFRIVVAGLGGVGGFFGGKLAAHYPPGHAGVEVSFVARGANEAAIRTHGLRVEEADRGSWTAFPAHLTHHPAELAPADLVIVCTKSYDLEATIEQLRPCLGPATVVLPLLNGVDSAERIARLLPGQPVWEGCVYIVARLAAPGRVRVANGPRTLLFGSPTAPAAQLARVETLLRAAGIEAQLAPDIRRTVWEKFVFISPGATLTSAFDMPLADVLARPDARPLLDGLLVESQQLAAALGVALPPDVAARTLARMAAMPAGTTSSMHSDFLAGKPTELESLTGYVVRRSRTLGLACPTYEGLYAQLLRKTAAVSPMP